MKNVVYRGAGTGLLLEGDNGDTLDVGDESAAIGSPLNIFVGTRGGASASIALSAPEVVLLMEACVNHIAKNQGVPVPRERV